MNKNEKDFMDQLNNLDDISVEEIADNYPALNENTKKRILKKCMEKSKFFFETDHDGKEELIISGTERYNRNPWYKFAASAAALVLAVGGITGVLMLNRNIVGNDPPETGKTSAVRIYDSSSDSKSEQTAVTTSDNNHTVSDYTSAITNAYSGIIMNATSQISTTVIEPSTVTETTGYSEEESETQKSYLEGRYFIVTDNRKYDGFEFSLDGTIRKFTFDVPYGNFKRYTGESFGYEIIENLFSYGTIGDEANWKTGTIINSNDGIQFSVQFDDSVYTFSKDSSIFEEKFSLCRTNWYKYELNGPIENYIEFSNDGFSGYYITPPEDYTTTDAVQMHFTYTQNGNDITFYADSKTATGKLSSSNNDPRGKNMMLLVWSDGLTEYLFNDDMPITYPPN